MTTNGPLTGSRRQLATSNKHDNGRLRDGITHRWVRVFVHSAHSPIRLARLRSVNSGVAHTAAQLRVIESLGLRAG